MTDHRRVLIVGGGIAGWTVASSLREGGYDGSIVVIEREPACYDRPPLSKTALVDRAPLETLVFADAAETARQGIEVRTGRTVTELDAAHLAVVLDDGERLFGDAVVLATGALARTPSFPGGSLTGVSTLRSYADAVALHSLIGRDVAVVGAGLIGAEAAAALRQAGSTVVLIDPNALPGTHAFGSVMASHLHDMHAAHGVQVRADVVSTVAATNGRLRVELAHGAPIEVDGVLVGTGVVVETALARSAGLDVEGGIIVDEAGRTSMKGVFAAGDATRRRLPAGLETCRGHWDAARLDARAVSAAILDGNPAPRGVDWFWSDRYGHHIEVAGDMAGDGDEVVRPGAHPMVFRVADGRILAAASVDDPMSVRAARRLIDHALPVDPAQLTDPGVQLRSLLPRA